MKQSRGDRLTAINPLHAAQRTPVPTHKLHTTDPPCNIQLITSPHHNAAHYPQHPPTRHTTRHIHRPTTSTNPPPTTSTNPPHHPPHPPTHHIHQPATHNIHQPATSTNLHQPATSTNLPPTTSTNPPSTHPPTTQRTPGARFNYSLRMGPFLLARECLPGGTRHI